MSATDAATGIRPFQIDVPKEQLAALRTRIAATRWPSRELVSDRSQGVQLATIQALAEFWATEHDWRACAPLADRVRGSAAGVYAADPAASSASPMVA